MHSKDYQILVDKLEKEIEKLNNRKTEIYQNMEAKHVKEIQIADDYIDYHNEIIRFIKRVDKEVYEK